MRRPTLQELYYIVGIIVAALGIIISSIIYWEAILPVLTAFLGMLRSRLHIVLLYIAVIYLLYRDTVYRKVLTTDSNAKPDSQTKLSNLRNDEGDEHGSGGN